MKQQTQLPISDSQPETPLEKFVRIKFQHLSNAALVKRANSLPDFKWDDEEAELVRRIKVSTAKFELKMIGSQLQIIKDE